MQMGYDGQPACVHPQLSTFVSYSQLALFVYVHDTIVAGAVAQ
jgi:hypothetical protein